MVVSWFIFSKPSGGFEVVRTVYELDPRGVRKP